MGSVEWTLLLVLSVVWGASFFFFKILVEVLPPLTVVAGRVVLASAALGLLLRLQPGRQPWPKGLVWPFLLLGAISNVIPFTLIAWGETRVSSGMAAIINASVPVFTVLIAHALTHDEKLSWNRSLGALAAFAGVALLIGPAAFTSTGRAALPGQIACLVASVTYGFATVYGRRFKGIPPLQIATGQLVAAAVITVPLALAFDRPWSLPAPSAGVWAAWAGLALLSTAFAYVLYFRLLAVAGATNASLVTVLQPVHAIALGVLFLGEVLELRSLAGFALIGLGLLAVDGRLLKRRRG